MKKISLIFLFGIFFINLNGQTILKIDNQNVSLDEFKGIFYKNNHEEEITKEYLNEYMELFVNFKLKVKEAIELGLDTNQNFIINMNANLTLVQPVTGQVGQTGFIVFKQDATGSRTLTLNAAFKNPDATAQTLKKLEFQWAK